MLGSKVSISSGFCGGRGGKTGRESRTQSPVTRIETAIKEMLIRVQQLLQQTQWTNNSHISSTTSSSQVSRFDQWSIGSAGSKTRRKETFGNVLPVNMELEEGSGILHKSTNMYKHTHTHSVFISHFYTCLLGLLWFILQPDSKRLEATRDLLTPKYMFKQSNILIVVFLGVLYWRLYLHIHTHTHHTCTYSYSLLYIRIINDHAYVQ